MPSGRVIDEASGCHPVASSQGTKLGVYARISSLSSSVMRSNSARAHVCTRSCTGRRTLAPWGRRRPCAIFAILHTPPFNLKRATRPYPHGQIAIYADVSRK